MPLIVTASPCIRWGTVAPLTMLRALALCAACFPAGGPPPACEPFAHQWRGHRGSGEWLCLTCGSTLASEAIATEPVVTL